jgi:hypothetical protein
VVTVDGSLAAHWENTIAITADGPRILTEPSLAEPTTAGSAAGTAGGGASLPGSAGF